ncbi:Similar to mfsd5: Molybdate-anion transporter (Takifugu rubripes) [Cotesia congregata]|uniref:Molybdate-anion transporter n=1 Tax=Cotesia congregata TaxID=51543 RepID=A0A8J2HCE3_COTCN|nr:Similar to mfsd5: Molybdate-anion transporter (Takifugu rubripes) [Cotesia congregata]
MVSVLLLLLSSLRGHNNAFTGICVLRNYIVHFENVHCAEKSEVMAKAYANRSAILCNERFYESSLDDVNDALEIGYPENLKAKLYVRQTKCLIARFPNSLRGVDNCLQKAQFWSEKMDPANKKTTQAVIAKLKKNKTVPEPREIWFASEYLPNGPQGNPKIMRASSAVALKYSAKYGRHLVATRDIKAGEALVLHQSYASSLYPEHFYNHCWYCTTQCLNPIPCLSCVDVVYCSHKCRESAWKEYHDVECKVIGVMLRAEMYVGEIMAVKILIKALKETGSIQKLREKVEEIESISDPLDKTYTNGRFDDSKYASFYSLMRIPMNGITHVLLCENVLKSIGLTYFLAALTDLFGEKTTSYEDVFKNEDALFIARLLYHHQMIIRTNAVKMERDNEKGEYRRHSGVIAPLFKLVNHSCDRNVYHFFADDKNAMIAIQPIKEGEQIFTCVGPQWFDIDTQRRRSILHLDYDFHCNCYACRHDWCPSFRFPTCLDQNLSKKGRETVLKVKSMVERCIRPSLWNKMTIEDKVKANLPKRIACIIKALNILKNKKNKSINKIKMETEKIEIYQSLKRKYLIVYLLGNFVDWIQGPYLYKLYLHYEYTTTDISILYITGFLSSAISGVLIGHLADKFGRKKLCVFYFISTIVACLCTNYSDLMMLHLGRIFGGISASILFSSFESWYISRHLSADLPHDWMGSTLASSTFYNGLLAIAAGILASILADTLDYGPVAPFMFTIPVCILSGLICMTTWRENSHKKVYSNLLQGLSVIFRNDGLLIYLGLIQTLFETIMYTFIFLWTPILDPIQLSNGLIFSLFMLCIVFGSALHSILVNYYQISRLMLLCSSVVLALFSIAVSTIGIHVQMQFDGEQIGTYICLVSFLIFEISVGIYYPAIGYLRGIIVPEVHRTSVANWFRLPSNLLICVVLLYIRIGVPDNRLIFALSAMCLSIASLYCVEFVKAYKRDYSIINEDKCVNHSNPKYRRLLASSLDSKL